MAIQRRFVFLVLSVAFLTSVAAWSASAQTAVIVGLFPASANLAPGQTVDFELRVDRVQALYGLDVRVSFDPRILEAMDLDPAQEGVQIAPGQFPHPDFTIKNQADNLAGTVWYAVTQLNPRPPANGSGAVMTMRFRAKAEGVAAIAIAQIMLATRDGALLPATTSGGGQISVSPISDVQATSRPSELAPSTSATATRGARLAVVAPTGGQTPQPTLATRHTTRSFTSQRALIVIVISLILLALLVYLIRRTKTAAPQ